MEPRRFAEPLCPSTFTETGHFARPLCPRAKYSGIKWPSKMSQDKVARRNVLVVAQRKVLRLPKCPGNLGCTIVHRGSFRKIPKGGKSTSEDILGVCV